MGVLGRTSIMEKHGIVISLLLSFVRKIKKLFCGDKITGKDEFCIILLKHLYFQKSLDGIDIKEITRIINKNNNCDLEKIFRFSRLSSELYCFLYRHDDIFANGEKRVLSNVIAQREDEINSLFTKQTDLATKKYIRKNIYWFLALFVLTYGSTWVHLLAKGVECSYPFIALLTITYFAIAALLILVPDCLLWIADKSNFLEHGCLVHFLERKYNQFGWVKSFFDYHTKEKIL